MKVYRMTFDIAVSKFYPNILAAESRSVIVRNEEA